MIKWVVMTDKIGNCDKCGETVPCIYRYCQWCGAKLH